MVSHGISFSHQWTTACSGHNVGVVRGEAICDAPVPRESVSDGSQVPSFGPLVCVTGVLIVLTPMWMLQPV